MEYCRAFACKCRCLVLLFSILSGMEQIGFVTITYYYTPSPQGWSILVLYVFLLFLLFLLFLFFRQLNWHASPPRLLNRITLNFTCILQVEVRSAVSKKVSDLGIDLDPRSHEWCFTKMAISPILSKIFQFRLQIMKA